MLNTFLQRGDRARVVDVLGNRIVKQFERLKEELLADSITER